MKRASEVLILIGTILSFVTCGIMAIVGIVCLIVGSDAVKEALIEGIENGSITTTISDNAETAAAILQITFRTLGIVYIVWAVLLLTNGIVASNTRHNPSKNGYILNIVFGFLSCLSVNAVGGIFGVIVENRKENTVIE